MKTLENKPTAIAAEGEDPIDYVKLIGFCLDNAPKGGFTRVAMRERQRIENATKLNGNSTIELEDADAKNLKRVVAAMSWGKRHEDILQFLDDVEAMPTKEAK